MKLANSHALRLFKREVGQSNHMLITILVGLDSIIDNDSEARPEFHTIWNPKNKSASVNRSRIFARKAVLVWLVDCLDMYLRIINQNPSMLTDIALKHAYDGEDISKSVYKRLNLLLTHYKIVGIEPAFIDLVVNWRNRLTHFNAVNDITPKSRKILMNEYERIKQEYNGLNIKLTLEAFDRNDAPTFKEVASLTRATINTVYLLDAKLISQTDTRRFANAILIKYFLEDKDLTQKRLHNIYSRGPAGAQKSYRKILSQFGFNDEPDDLVDSLCTTASILGVKGAKACCDSRSFIDNH